MCLVLGLVVGRVEVVASRLQAGLHNCEVLIGQGEVHHYVGLKVAQQSHQLVDIVGIHSRCLDVRAADSLDNRIAFALCATGNHYLTKHIRVLGNLVRGHGGYTARTDNKYSLHKRAKKLKS